MNDVLLIAQQTPSIDSMYWLMLLSRLLHILSAIILVGGIFYLRAVITSAAIHVPSREGPGEGSETVDHLFTGRRATWAMWVGIASLLLLVTGLWNFIYTVKLNQLHWSYHMLGTVKILLGLALMAVAALLAGRSAAANAIRAKWRLWLSVALFLGIILVVVGSVMRTYPRTLKPDAPGPSEVVAIKEINATTQPTTD
jgi:uncharacterized membrane protein